MSVKRTVLMPLARGVEETEAIAVIDVLRRAGLDVTTAALEPGPVESSHGVSIVPDAQLEAVAAREFDAVVLPGGHEGTNRLAASDLVADVVRRAARAGKITAAICAAPTVLAALGLLDGRRATCHASREKDLAGAIFVNEPVVVDGTIVTSRGAGTALEFGLELAALLAGRDEADQIARAIHLRR
jgi:4-methyl-5(b-hydroxyethyl)-thiazole monophosphate biosynthesis